MGKWLLVILALAGFLRIVGLNQVPVELFGDEVDVGYQAYSLLKTGKDLYGQTLPTYIHSLAEWRAPLLMYATVPTIAVFGNTEWGVRLPSAIWGSLAPIILFLLVYQTTKSKSISLLSSLALALMPWHIHYSRVGFEVVIMLNLIMLATLLFIKKRYALCLLIFAISMYTYSTAVLFVPVWIIALVLISKKIPSFLSLLLFTITIIPLAYHVVVGPARDRFGLLSLSRDQEKTQKLLQLRQADPGLTGRLFTNKYESYLHQFWDNYLRSFSTEFLFVRGDPVYRHSIQVIGQLLPFTFPLLAVGVWWLTNRKLWGWLIWLILAPVPASLTVDGGFHATRLFLMVPPLAVGIGTGVIWLFRRWKVPAILLLAVCLFQFTWSAYYYWVHYSRLSWRWWNSGFKQAMIQLNKLSPQYSRVFINNTYEPSLIRFLFWTKYSPVTFHRQFTTEQVQKEIVPYYDGFTVDGKYFFGNFTEANWPSHLLPGAVYLISQRDNVGGDWDWRKTPPEGVRVLFTSTNLYDQPILYLVAKR